jgi:nicotinate-nucleotide pyrophosphorylase (carboxylating)
MNIVQLRDIVARALKEDIGFGDLTTEAIAAENVYTRGTFTVKAEGVLAGLQVAGQVFATLDPTVKWEAYVPDGQVVRPGQTAAADRSRETR